MSPTTLSRLILNLDSGLIYLNYEKNFLALEDSFKPYSLKLNEAWGPTFREFLIRPTSEKCGRWKEFFLYWLRFGFSNDAPYPLHDYLSLKHQSLSEDGYVSEGLKEIEAKLAWLFAPWDFSRPWQDPEGEFLFDVWLMMKGLLEDSRAGKAWLTAVSNMSSEVGDLRLTRWLNSARVAQSLDQVGTLDPQTNELIFSKSVALFLSKFPNSIGDWINHLELELGLRDFISSSVSEKTHRRGLSAL